MMRNQFAILALFVSLAACEVAPSNTLDTPPTDHEIGTVDEEEAAWQASYDDPTLPPAEPVMQWSGFDATTSPEPPMFEQLMFVRDPAAARNAPMPPSAREITRRKPRLGDNLRR